MYGLIPARKAFSICLRCQARIAAKTSFHHSSAPTHLAGRSFHQTRRQLENQEIAYDEGQHDELPVDHGPDSAEGAPARSRHRGRSFRRLNVNQWEVALGVDALGKPAQIRIVKDASPQRSKEKETQVENKADDADAKLLREEFLDALATEKNKVNTAVVYEHIEAIRSKFLVERDSSKIPETLRELVAKQLQDGFTVAQLKRYIKDHPSRMPSAADNLEQAYSSKIYTRSKWTSGVSSFPGEALKRLEDTELQARNKQPFKLYANSSRKERLVETILHELWGIRSRIDREVDGELDISIAGPQFEVLFRNKKTVFESLSENHAVKLELSQSNNVVRITGSYYLCLDIFRLLQATINNVKLEEISVSPPKDPNKEFPVASWSAIDDGTYIGHVEKLTNTCIRPVDVSGGKRIPKVKVYYLGPDKTGLSDARRLILQILAPQTPNGSIVQCFPLIKPLAIDKVPVEASFALPLQEKYLPWYRLKKPIHARLGSSTSLPKERSPLEDENRRMMSLVVKHTKNQLSKAWAHLPPITQNETKHENWSSDVSKSLSASLGYVMHSGELETKSFLNAPENDGYSSPWNKSARETFSWRSRSARTIFTSVPGLERVLELGIGTPSVANMLMIQLRPVKMKNGPKRLELSRVPWLEVLVDVDNKTRTLQVQSARLVRDWRVADLLLPDKARDIRFQSRSTITSTEHLDDGIQRFVDKSKLDVWGNDRLMTPARLNVTVPLFSCRVLPGNAAKEIVKQEGQGSVEVDYLFSKLEHWSTLRVKLNEYELNYATVEGGQSGGRREELTLETAGWTRTGVSGDDEGEFQKFFRQARRLAAITPRGSTPSNTYN